MKILFLHANQPDYLAESLFHGLRQVLGNQCVDVPRYDSLYRPLTDQMRRKLRGNGFTLYGLLDDCPELMSARYFWQSELEHYDRVIIANIWQQSALFGSLYRDISPQKLVLIDGHDHPTVFPFALRAKPLQQNPWLYVAPVSKFPYFKRELIGEGYSYGFNKVLPKRLRQRILLPKHLRPISFSIPKEKITPIDPAHKIKDFPTHIVDPEVAGQLPKSFFSAIGSDQYQFTSEFEYYQDLQQSRFGITTKRAGWDCLRHYELAANGCVLCFRDLDLKPDTCAPHGLSRANCIIYHSVADLQHQIRSLSSVDYRRLQKASYEWIHQYTTEAVAQCFLEECFKSSSTITVAAL